MDAKHYQFTVLKIASLVPYARNSRIHSERQLGQIVASIREFGFTNPVLVDERGGIIAGHGRVMAAARLGLEEVPCVVLAGLTEAQRRAYVIADNKLALNAKWDEDLLREEMAALRDLSMDLDVLGFGTDELEDLLGRQQENTQPDTNTVPPAPARPVSSLGTVWVCGPHRVICGDSTSAEALAAVMDGAEADMVWTDPPYNVAYKGKAGTIKNDDMSDADFAAFLLNVFAAVGGAVRKGGAVYVAHAESMSVALRRALEAADIKVASTLIWRKNQFVMGRGDYHYQHEPILYGWREGAAHRFFGGRRKSTIQEFAGEVFTKTGENEWNITVGETTLVISGSDVRVEELCGDVFFEDKPRRSTLHPTTKPVALVERMVVNSSRKGDVVLDPFGGSGSTLIACSRTGRIARLVELAPVNVDVIVERWEAFAGGVAVRLQDGKKFGELRAAMAEKKAA